MINWIRNKYVDYQIKKTEIDMKATDKLQKLKDVKLNNDINNINKSHEKYKLEQLVKNEQKMKKTFLLKALVFFGALGSAAMTIGGTDIFRKINNTIGFWDNPVMSSILIYVLIIVQLFTFYAAKIKPSTYKKFNLHYNDMVLLSVCLIPLSMLCNFRFLNPYFKVFDIKLIDSILCLLLCFLYDKAIISFLGYETSRKNLLFSYPIVKETKEKLQNSILSKLNVFKPRIQNVPEKIQELDKSTEQDFSGLNSSQDLLQDNEIKDNKTFRISQDLKKTFEDTETFKQVGKKEIQEDIRNQDSYETVENSTPETTPKNNQDNENKLQDSIKQYQEVNEKLQDFSGMNPETKESNNSQEFYKITEQDFSGLNPKNKNPENLSREEKAILVSEIVKTYKDHERIKISNFKHLGIKGNASDADWKYIRNYLKDKNLLYVKDRFSYKKAN